MKWTLLIVAVLVGLILLVVFIGLLLPRNHVASVSAVIDAPADSVWSAITDVAAYPTWRKEVRSVELISRSPAPLSWREHARGGDLTFVVETVEPPRRFVSRIADENLPFGGAWEYVLAADGTDASRTRVTITERGYVPNPIFRFVSSVFLGHHSTLEGYVKALGRKFGADVAPVRS